MRSRPAEYVLNIGNHPRPSSDLSHAVLFSALGDQPLAGAAAAAAVDMTVATKAAARAPRVPGISRLGTPEFKLYYLLYLVVVPSMAYTAYQASSPARPEYAEYEQVLSPGWMLGRKVDLSDGQWRTFRQHLPEFAGAMLAYVVLSWAARWAVRGREAAGALPSLWFPCAFATAFVVGLSGASIVFIAALVAGNYVLAKRAGGRRWAPWAIWVYNIVVLFANEYGDGYHFGRIHSNLAWLDPHRGVLRRWDVTFNITMLRMVSFAMDYHWSRQQQQQQDSVGPPVHDLSAKDRIERSCSDREYCFVNYWAYLLYPPLYLTGPVITFNDFVAQMRRPAPPSARSTALYGVRLVLSFLLMELVLHTVHCVAIGRMGRWDGYTVYEISMLGYMRLTFIWLKLLVIWRFARFWAMVDGLETVENMRRCMSNNYSLQQFWRDWHCSYNRWLVRYVYIPLGGRKTSTWNVFVVFTFVALWHDLTLRLLQWAWIIALLFLPEGLATWYFGQPRWAARPYFRFLCSAGGALNIIGMMIGNLVGFGDEGVDDMLAKIFSWNGAAFLATAYVLFNVHLQVMFEWREYEHRRDYHARGHRDAPVEMAARGEAPGQDTPSLPPSGESSSTASPRSRRAKTAAQRA